MRRMYSKQQLEEIAKYLVEHSELNFLEDIAFTGDVSIGGDLSITGDASVGGDLPVVGKITGGEIIENMGTYSFSSTSVTGLTKTHIYAGVVKNGNKITFVIYTKINRTEGVASNGQIGSFSCPADIMAKIYPTDIGGLQLVEAKLVNAFSAYNSRVALNGYVEKTGGGSVLAFYVNGLTGLTAETDYVLRFELTLLLSDSLVQNP